jgi:hypothetical protein
MKCDTCGKEVAINCDWHQGRCPHRTPFLTDYHFRFLNLIQSIQNLFKK